tara:strand:+ start:3763 stop:3981 length:219 start_codon:yes stop_codon:yes gene_type:complete
MDEILNLVKCIFNASGFEISNVLFSQYSHSIIELLLSRCPWIKRSDETAAIKRNPAKKINNLFFDLFILINI